MNKSKDKTHLELLTDRYHKERLLIASGAIFQLICGQVEPISEVAIASELEISVPLVRRTLKELSTDNLVAKNTQGGWTSQIVTSGLKDTHIDWGVEF